MTVRFKSQNTTISDYLSITNICSPTLIFVHPYLKDKKRNKIS